ncbi:MAG: hypothetical protein D3910_22605, partial [Candidatus Electrothrix sp. ATG2]|nr:hypothetical protein [Candidatus Electrothrix sp. ATG2]
RLCRSLSGPSRHGPEAELRPVMEQKRRNILFWCSRPAPHHDPMNDRLMDVAAVEEKYGLKPEQLLDYLSLTGDSADNISGVPGVGPKTAQKMK